MAAKPHEVARRHDDTVNENVVDLIEQRFDLALRSSTDDSVMHRFEKEGSVSYRVHIQPVLQIRRPTRGEVEALVARYCEAGWDDVDFSVDVLSDQSERYSLSLQKI